MKLRSRLLALISAIIGLALFTYVIYQTGLAEIGARIRLLGAGFLLILAISSFRYLSRSLSWLRCMTPEERHVGFWTLWRARLAGEAIGDLTIGPLVGEPMKVIALGDKLSLSSGISSLAVENIAYAVSSCLMVMAGAIVLMSNYGLNRSLRITAQVSLVVIVVLIIALFVAIGRRWKLVSILTARLIRVLIRSKSKQIWVEEKIEHLRRMEDYLFDFCARRPRDFVLVALSQIAFHFAGVMEIYATLRLIGVDLMFTTAFMLEAVNRAFNIAFIFVPALVGVDEAGTGLVTSTLGLGAAVGVTLAIVRKIRMFFWIGIGLIFLAVARRSG